MFSLIKAVNLTTSASSISFSILSSNVRIGGTSNSHLEEKQNHLFFLNYPFCVLIVHLECIVRAKVCLLFLFSWPITQKRITKKGCCFKVIHYIFPLSTHSSIELNNQAPVSSVLHIFQITSSSKNCFVVIMIAASPHCKLHETFVLNNYNKKAVKKKPADLSGHFSYYWELTEPSWVFGHNVSLVALLTYPPIHKMCIHLPW